MANLLNDVWSKKKYYDLARSGSMDFSHPAMQELLSISKNKKNILDMGCGEGTRLNSLIKRNQKGYGIDVSPEAIKIAKRKYKNLDLVVSNLEKMPYKDNSFDLVYSAFVFEHLDNPKKVINEAIRVLKPNGSILIVCPNYGSPNRASPPFKGNRLLKMTKGILSDLFVSNNLNWNKVEPIASKNEYHMDWDTTIEPYLGSLIKYLKTLGLKITTYSSCWIEDDMEASIIQKCFKLLGRMKLYPFYLWGPHLMIVAKKQK